MGMTREKAIKEYVIPALQNTWNEKINKEVLEALEQEPTTKNNLEVDCISRTRAIERLKLNFPTSQGADNSRDRHRYMQALADLQAIKELPSVTPQEPKCKDCKWWKDSDGEYRRGCGAESICRINTVKVYRGEGYCYLFEPQDEDKE